MCSIAHLLLSNSIAQFNKPEIHEAERFTFYILNYVLRDRAWNEKIT